MPPSLLHAGEKKIVFFGKKHTRFLANKPSVLVIMSSSFSLVVTTLHPPTSPNSVRSILCIFSTLPDAMEAVATLDGLKRSASLRLAEVVPRAELAAASSTLVGKSTPVT